MNREDLRSGESERGRRVLTVGTVAIGAVALIRLGVTYGGRHVLPAPCFWSPSFAVAARSWLR